MLAAMLLMIPPAAAASDLYLMLNVGDSEDREIADAALTLEGALDGKKPSAIDSKAERYFVLMPEATTLETFQGSARMKGERPSAGGGESGSHSSSAEAAAEDVDSGETGWIELETAVASVFYFSPQGEGESSWRREPPRMFIRRLADDRIVVMFGEKGADPPGR